MVRYRMPPLFSVKPPSYSWKKKIRAEGRDESERRRAESQLSQRHVPLGAKWPLLLVGKRAAGACIASSPDSDLEAFSHNPAHGPAKSRSQSVPRPARDDPLSPRVQLEQSTDSRRVQDWDPRAQSSEPILFPKLRIHFADFPCLHCSIDQRLFTLETCCGYEYDLA
ncbi:hypothetical protein RHSIM_Rhsim05G0123400 [Rhododendron simsii]|uniref:Uncharacterized protein n=1 Tax=Rhododendron simsii TaxID=118357 RepID=A0A834GZB6_RHOSS|nr:hypothetical protein RHSIM_Rhsim05G0123400 [Rhododendron simsii]